LTAKAAKTKPLHLRLEDWIDEHFFGFAQKKGWFNAITYYAIRDPRYQRAEVCWSECVRKWKKAMPRRYPTLEEWKKLAGQSDPTALLVPRERTAQACLNLVHPDRLSRAVPVISIGRPLRTGLDQLWSPAARCQQKSRRN